MCLIIKKPQGRQISGDFLSHAWSHNAHGWGSFHVGPSGLMWSRGMALTELLEYNQSLPKDAEAFVHLRRATCGEVSRDMAHPFQVRSGLYLMHNGHIDQFVPSDCSRSDTHELARVLRDMLAGLSDPQASALVRSNGFRAMTAPLLKESTLVLMDALGPICLGRPWHAISASDWCESMAGIHVSNMHTWGRQLRAVQDPPYTQSGTRTRPSEKEVMGSVLRHSDQPA